VQRFKNHPLIERTLILAKHDSVQRGLIGEIISRFEQRGLKISGMKMTLPTESQLGEHYFEDEAWMLNVGQRNRKIMAEKGIEMKEDDIAFGRKIREYNMQSIRGTPIVAMIFEGLHATEIGRKIVGHTEPAKAEPGTLRGDYSTESFRLADVDKRVVRNLVHASGNKDEAKREINVWFDNDEIFEYEKRDWLSIHTFD